MHARGDRRQVRLRQRLGYRLQEPANGVLVATGRDVRFDARAASRPGNHSVSKLAAPWIAVSFITRLHQRAPTGRPPSRIAEAEPLIRCSSRSSSLLLEENASQPMSSPRWPGLWWCQLAAVRAEEESHVPRQSRILRVLDERYPEDEGLLRSDARADSACTRWCLISTSTQTSGRRAEPSCSEGEEDKSVERDRC